MLRHLCLLAFASATLPYNQPEANTNDILPPNIGPDQQPSPVQAPPPGFAPNNTCPVGQIDLQSSQAIFQLNPRQILSNDLSTVYNRLSAMELQAFCATKPQGSYCYHSNLTRNVSDAIAMNPDTAPVPTFPIPRNSPQWGGFGAFYAQCSDVVVVRCPEGIVQRCKENFICFDTASDEYTSRHPQPPPVGQLPPAVGTEAAAASASTGTAALVPNSQRVDGGRAQCKLWLEAAVSAIQVGPTRTVVVVRPTATGSAVATLRIATLTVTPRITASITQAPLQLECTVATLTAVPVLRTDAPDLEAPQLVERTNTVVPSETLSQPFEICWNTALPQYIMPIPCPGGPYPPGLIKRFSAACGLPSLTTPMVTPTIPTAALTTAMATSSAALSAIGTESIVSQESIVPQVSVPQVSIPQASIPQPIPTETVPAMLTTCVTTVIPVTPVVTTPPPVAPTMSETGEFGPQIVTL